MLKKRRLGKANISVSEIGLGCWELGGLTTINGIPLTYGNVDSEVASDIIKTALKLGVNTFDTADSYSLGNSERRLGTTLKENRSEVNLFTKAGVIPSFSEPLPTETDLSYHHLIASIDRSLKRLNTDHVELFHAHKPPKSENDLQNIEKAFNKIKEEGKSLYCGVSIGLDYDIGMELIKRGFIDTIQLYFSLLNFKPIEELLPLAKRNGIGIIVAEPLEQGFLSGKYHLNHSFPKTDIRSISYSQEQIKKKIERSRQFQFLSNEKRTMSQVALAYALSRDEISTCIPGSKSTEQTILNVKAADTHLASDELKAIEEIQQKWKD